jgi:hypothetical protein
MIVNMPLREGAIDFLAWHFDSRGVHSVRSAYKLYMENLLNLEGGDVGQSNDRPEVLGGRGKDIWWRIWRLECPNKIKHFLWRCAHNSLATRDNLIRRGVTIDNPRCLFCNRTDEHACHLFVRRKEVKTIWRELGLEPVRLKLESKETVREVLDELWKLGREQRIQIVTFWWLWWRERNRIREGDIPAKTEDMVYQIKCSAAEYSCCFTKVEGTAGQRCMKWQPPPKDVIKFNVDGSYTEGIHAGGWGVVARDHDGAVIAAKASCSEAIHNAFTAELRAMEEAVNLAADLRVIRVEFETDAQLLAMTLSSKRPDFSTEAVVIEDLKLQSRMWFSSCSFRFTKRSSNGVAHNLA